MAVNERTASLLHAQFRALHATLNRRKFPDGVAVAAPSAEPEPGYVGQVLTTLMHHGGLYTLTDTEMMSVRLIPMLSGPNTLGMNPEDIDSFISSISSKVATFFSHLVSTTRYTLDSSLVSHLTLPGKGLMFTQDSCAAPGTASSMPAAFTFVGQFIDHDLTMNGVNLFDPQTGPVQNTASPVIDLDSVYGPRTLLDMLPPAPTPGGMSLPDSIFNPDGTFKLHKKSAPGGSCYWDLRRDPITHMAYISDARNDENQMVLQIQLLNIRVHNKLMRTVYNDPGTPLQQRMGQAYLETLLNWQSVIKDDYLTRILLPATYADLLTQIQKPDFGTFKYKPLLKINPDPDKYLVSLPHEFAIGFRIGHSQLRPCYALHPGGPDLPLFDNSLRPNPQGHIGDLRGSQDLRPERVIDWNFFANNFKSNLIDDKVTSVVFDLPESTIPDDIKFIGNLAQRNLIRSSQVGLCSGEDLAGFYGIDPLTPQQVDTGILTPDQSDPVYGLYLRQKYDSNGIPVTTGVKPHQKPVMEFATPLWYYLLREATLLGQDGSLGPLGSRLIGEVIFGALAWGRHSIFTTPRPTNIPTATPGKVVLTDLAAFVQGDCP